MSLLITLKREDRQLKEKKNASFTPLIFEVLTPYDWRDTTQCEQGQLIPFNSSIDSERAASVDVDETVPAKLSFRHPTHTRGRYKTEDSTKTRFSLKDGCCSEIPHQL